MKINLQLPVEEFEFIKVAVQEKAKAIVDYMDASKKIAESVEKMHADRLWEMASSIDEAEFEKELEKVTGKKKSKFAYKPVKDPAPYGLKKDGTPKKKSGRPLRKGLK